MTDAAKAESLAPSPADAARRLQDEGQSQAITGLGKPQVREGEVVVQEFPPPTSVDGKRAYAFRCSVFHNTPYILVRGEDAVAINADSCKRIADNAKKMIPQYSGCGIESNSAGYPIDLDTGNMADLHKGQKLQKVGKQLALPYIYERRFRINVSLGVF